MSKASKHLIFRAYLIYFGFVAAMLVVLYYTVSLQFANKKNGEASLGSIKVRTVDRTPRMGEILDANLLPLVTSVAYYNIYMDPTVVNQKMFDAEVSALAEGLGKINPIKTAREWENQIRAARLKGSRYLIIKKLATNTERNQFRKLPIFSEGRMKGGIIDNEIIINRKKPNGDLLGRTLGYRKIIDGKVVECGIEGAFYDFLKGEVGAEVEQKISSGWRKTGQILKDAVEGADVVSTIDKEIQEVAHSELEKQLKEMDARSGSVIVMDVKTGYVRAIVNLSKNANGLFSENFNDAFGSLESPGSTFKLASLMAALEDKKITINEKINAKGVYLIHGAKLSDSNHGMGYGEITIQQAFEKSSNVIAVLMDRIYKNDPEKLMARLDAFGITKPLGIALTGEAPPDIPRPGDSRWSPLSIPWMSIGYGIRQTPLQTLAFYNAVANNGKLLRPQFVQEIIRRGESIKKFNPIVLNEQICSKETIAILKACLEGVMTQGTGSALSKPEIGSGYQCPQFKIGGKTGTTKLLGKNNEYLDEDNSVYQASFVGYFPADKPQYSCIVVITDPKKEYYGAKVAGRVFVEIANKVWASSFDYHQAINAIKPTKLAPPVVKPGSKDDVINALKSLGLTYTQSQTGDWLSSITTESSIDFSTYLTYDGFVPNVIGMGAKDAVYLLESKGLIVQIFGHGAVFHQSINPNTKLFKGGLIQLQLK